MGRDARARAIQLPAWNEALGLPRPWDQQWSLRIQQILAYETDLLEYPDIFEGSKVMDGLVAELIEGARAEMAVVEEQGGAVEAVPYMKARLVESHRERIARIERGEIKVVGQNSFTESEDSPLTAGADGGILTPDPEVERECREALERWRAERDADAVEKALAELRAAAADEQRNIMPATIAAAKAGVTTGEWAQALRDAFGDYRGPTGVGASSSGASEELLAEIRARVDEVSDALGHRIRILVGKPGLDGHSNGAEQIAVRARDVGMEVIYQGIRLTPEQIAASAADEDVDVVGLSILSGSHLELIPDTVRLLREREVDAPGRDRRDHPRGRRAAAARGRASPASTRPRTSRSTGSWARSSSWSPSGPARPRRPDPAPEAALSPRPIEFPVEGITDGVVRLRLPADADVPRIVEACRDPEVSRYTTVPNPYQPSHTVEWMQRGLAGLAAGTDVHTVIAEAEARTSSGRSASTRSTATPAAASRGI